MQDTKHKNIVYGNDDHRHIGDIVNFGMSLAHKWLLISYDSMN